MYYSKTSNEGPPNNSQPLYSGQTTCPELTSKIGQKISTQPLKRGTSLKGTNSYSPMCPFFKGFTVYTRTYVCIFSLFEIHDLYQVHGKYVVEDLKNQIIKDLTWSVAWR